MKLKIDELVSATFALEGINAVTFASRLLRSTLYLLEQMTQQLDDTEEVRKLRDTVFRASNSYSAIVDMLVHLSTMSVEAKTAIHTSATVSGAHHLMCEWGEAKMAVHLLTQGMNEVELKAVVDYLKQEAAGDYTPEASRERKQRNIDALAKTVAHSTNIMNPAIKEEKPS